MNRFYAGYDYPISQHAKSRMGERIISKDDIAYIINNGIFERTEKNRNLYRLPESPFACLGGKRRLKLNGAAVILSEDECVVTVFWKDHRFTSKDGGKSWI
ncbi:MAG: DUF4258 domain-containing protein [Spirochaetaceae bacterium]|jgi:hypothetical protein|nr:DUF4258 domain-containing protein [Spirochaetaceae bacterium]